MTPKIRNLMLFRASLFSCQQLVGAFSGLEPLMRRTPLRYESRRYLYPQDFENLIQAATSNANGYAMGGDFAGLAATFNPGDGAFIPVPVHMIPDALIEW
jgi:hypothetical protein